MSEQNKQQPANNIAAFEENLLGTLFGFHEKAMRLLRNARLDDDKLNQLAERITSLLDRITAEMKQTPSLDLAEQLTTAYDKVERLVHELSDLPGGGEDA